MHDPVHSAPGFTSLENPYWSALVTEQSSFSMGEGLARRFQPAVIPFAGLAEISTQALADLRVLMTLDEKLWVTGESLPETAGLRKVSEIACLQMVCETMPKISWSPFNFLQMDCSDVHRMLELIAAAFPGFFLQRTCELGLYLGVVQEDLLVSMAGERLAIPGFREVSAVCTRPGYTGNGYAACLIAELIRRHLAASLKSILHVSAANQRAVEVYKRLGFVTRRELLFHQLHAV